jgi:hypothetical protein
MRLSVLAALGFIAFLGIMTINAPDANARARSTTVVSGPRGTAVVTLRVAYGLQQSCVVGVVQRSCVLHVARQSAVARSS